MDEPEETTDTELSELDSAQAGGLREGETGNPDIAAEEGLTWVPPVDPPDVPDSEGLEDIADDDEMSARVRQALRADAATSRYAGELAIAALDGVVAIRGVVDDIEDTDNVLEVAGRVTGVAEVIDELDVRALE